MLLAEPLIMVHGSGTNLVLPQGNRMFIQHSIDEGGIIILV